MARRNVLQEIPIPVPQTEHQSYEIVSEEDALPHNKPISSMERPHSRYISNDEAKENITPNQFEDLFKSSQVKVADSGNAGDLPSSSQASHVDLSTPKKKAEDSPEDLQPCYTPVDFSTVTVGDLGISTESFTTQCAGKSPKSLHKHRRRSTIGVRGSPEMNFLIRQIALQRSNRKIEPEPLDNPFTSPRNSILREKISAFRNAFQAVEESEGKLPFPGFSEAEELESEKGKGDVRPEPPQKRKKLCDTTDLGVPSTLHKPSVTLCPAQPLEILQEPVSEKTLEPDCSSASRLSTDVPSEPAEVPSDQAETLPKSLRSRKRKVMFTGLLSPPEPDPPLLLQSDPSSGPVLKPALKKTPRRDFVHFRLGFGEENRALFSLEESEDNDLNKLEDSLKKKRVTFGRALSPELFDKTLPANTPLRRGSTPYNYHKLDATPPAEQDTCQSPCGPMPQPDFSVKDEEDETFQPLSLCFDTESDSDSPVSSSLPEYKNETSPDEEEAAGHTRSSTDGHELVETSNEAAEETGTAADIVNESFIIPPEASPAATRKTRSSNKRKMTGAEDTPESDVSKAKVKVAAKKTRKPMISKKVQVKASRGKGKKKGGKSKKKPVYTEREAISKKPLLSPIPELPECVPTPPASTIWDFLPGKHLKKVHESKIHFTLEDSLEMDFEEKDPEQGEVEDVQTLDDPVGPALEDKKVLHHGSPENCGVISSTPSIECPQPPTGMEVTDQLSKEGTSSLGLSSEVETKGKTKKTKRHSSRLSITSEMTIKQDEDVENVSQKPEESVEDPVQKTMALPSISNEVPEESTTSVSSIATVHKKSRSSSRFHKGPNVLSTNPTQHPPGEDGPAMLPHLVDPSTIDFCLPIDEPLQFPPQEKKVRRSMRLRRDSGVNGLSWVEEIKVSETTGRRKSLSSVTKLEENTAQSPNKENLSSNQVTYTARRTRRRTLCTTTIQESVPASDTKRRRSNCFYKGPNATSAGDEATLSDLVPEA
ncbi:cell division cycle-associated protein 2 [Leptodactylus fuscus]|uniref:cell division cycle-associated protein 2 n=1 Tax=Leptodactylus fuscus TaxID=238119 RepID=UPI003F4E827B